jgi:hypothetical protein
MTRPSTGPSLKSDKRVHQRNQPPLKSITPFSASFSKSSERIHETNTRQRRRGKFFYLWDSIESISFLPCLQNPAVEISASFFATGSYAFRCSKWSCWLLRSEHRAAKTWCAEGTWWYYHCCSKRCRSVGGFMSEQVVALLDEIWLVLHEVTTRLRLGRKRLFHLRVVVLRKSHAESIWLDDMSSSELLRMIDISPSLTVQMNWHRRGKALGLRRGDEYFLMRSECRGPCLALTIAGVYEYRDDPWRVSEVVRGGSKTLHDCPIASA